MGEAQYAKRDLAALDAAGGHYSRHVSAMTSERLDRKSDIAAELAWRDAEIARLGEALRWYADRNHWRELLNESDDWESEAWRDQGERAIEALKGGVGA